MVSKSETSTEKIYNRRCKFICEFHAYALIFSKLLIVFTFEIFKKISVQQICDELFLHSVDFRRTIKSIFSYL